MTDDTTQTTDKAEAEAVAAPAEAEQSGGNNPMRDLARKLALAEANKPLEPAVKAIFSDNPEAAKKRSDLEDAFKKAVGEDGELKIAFGAAEKAFNRTVRDQDNDGSLKKWIDDQFKDKGELKKLLTQRKDVGDALAKLTGSPGDNEKARAEARTATEQWAKSFADWSDPVSKIKALIGKYAGEIDKLNADINNDVNSASAMTAFWFVIAPQHLQLAPDLENDVKTAVGTVTAKLNAWPDIKDGFKLGKDRDFCCLTMISADALADQRNGVLNEWTKAAEALADAEADFSVDPDDAARAKKLWDDLKEDKWIAVARKQLEHPAD